MTGLLACLPTGARQLRRALVGSLVAMSLLFPAVLEAQPRLVVLGLRSLEGDDEFALALSKALRRRARTEQRWRVSSRAPSLAQMALAYGCDDPDPSCLTDIALALRADKLIYGTVEREGSDSRIRVNVDLFDQDSGGVDASAKIVADAKRYDDASMRTLARQTLDTLTGRRASKPVETTPPPEPEAPPPVATGAVLVEANVMAALVSVDGEEAGQMQGGRLLLQEVSPGSHSIEVTAPGYEPMRTTVTVTAQRHTPVRLTLRELPSGQPMGWPRTKMWVGMSLVAGAAALVGATAFTWMRIAKLNDDRRLLNYRRAAGAQPMRSANVCDAAEAGTSFGVSPSDLRHVQDVCARASTLETLQYILIAASAIGGGVGAYLLVTGDREARATAASRSRAVSLVPRLSRDTAMLNAAIAF
ncbi:MAG: PEGA domain-containing protein [Proteobacteria bacterium]|nr:PEGA domain-containing protein [Pseudomonadota bacterium]